jgi:hypothetical protein
MGGETLQQYLTRAGFTVSREEARKTYYELRNNSELIGNAGTHLSIGAEET